MSPVRVFKYNVGVGLYLGVFTGVYAWVCAPVRVGLRMWAHVSVCAYECSFGNGCVHVSVSACECECMCVCM